MRTDLAVRRAHHRAGVGATGEQVHCEAAARRVVVDSPEWRAVVGGGSNADDVAEVPVDQLPPMRGAKIPYPHQLPAHEVQSGVAPKQSLEERKTHPHMPRVGAGGVAHLPIVPPSPDTTVTAAPAETSTICGSGERL